MNAINTTIKLPEILAPAGNFEKFRTALLYGANAVYLGGKSGNLRASSSGLSKDELALAVREAEAAKASIFYCLNSFPFENDLAALPGIIEDAAACGVHAFIIADPGLLRLARKYAPNIPVHLSTQANTTNSEAIKFWQDQGVSRINLARELDYAQMAAIRQNCPEMELEVFVHGAMCLAVSGQCLLSAWLNKRPANQGQCTQPCRFEYKAFDVIQEAVPHHLEVEESLRPGQKTWLVEQGEQYSAFWAPDDLCLLPYLPWFIKNGMDALKIEGRMKSASYVANVVDVYSSALKAAALVAGTTDTLESSAANDKMPNPRNYTYGYFPFLIEILRNSSRPLTSGFFLRDERLDVCSSAIDSGMDYTPGTKSSVLARIIEPANSDGSSWIVDIKENWNANEAAELMLPGLKRPLLPTGSYCFENHRGEAASQVLCGTRGVLHLGQEAENCLTDIVPGIFIRRPL